ncbi:hypothetical protein ACFST9_13330 [Hymenobacter monticola]|uniref:DUF4136 domain-containing protein n=1 Tax=Hymenobacter monticola TaxID=1705399 RepID=A0ABY4B6Z7_9BACT|nr:hypothetical protein [Hymenobacter monticola]UOE34928.1 hypothetical protein MTP16_04560 [Hymenobacter monticola]
MKKSHFLLWLLVGGLSLAAFARADWVTFALDERVSVQLPVQPTELAVAKTLSPEQAKTLSPEQVKNNHVYLTTDAYGTYQVVQSATGFSAEQAALAATRAAFYQRMLQGVLRHEHGTLLAQSPFPTAGGEGVEFAYRHVSRGSGKPVLAVARHLLVGTTSYGFTFTPRDQQDSTGTSGNAQRRRFFDSIVVKPVPGK